MLNIVRLSVSGLVVICLSCSRLVEIDPPQTRVQADVVLASNETAIALVTGIYARIGNEGPTAQGILPLNVLPGLSADELTLISEGTNTILQMFYTNQLATTPSITGRDFWQSIYSPYMLLVNTSINGLLNATTIEQNSNKSTLNESVRKQLLGEMQFFRAFLYFYLVQLYGDVPLLLTNDYVINSTAARIPKEIVYEQMVKDLQEAEKNLASNYVQKDVVSPGTSRIRPMKWAASALLSRVYLYMGKYGESEQKALSVIKNESFYRIVSLDSAFRADNREAIWQLQPVVTGRNTQEGWLFVLPASGPNSNYPVYLNARLLDVFEPGDQRKNNWVGSVTNTSGNKFYYPNKYKSAKLSAPVTEYSTVLRLAEQYLIAAECRAYLGDLAGGDSMLNVVRKRAGLAGKSSANKDSLINAVMHERQVEFFTEWGHRWFDLKRTGRVDGVMEVATPLKGGNSWTTTQQLYPILLTEIQSNNQLKQNAGY